jgi:hypothetical protein
MGEKEGERERRKKQMLMGIEPVKWSTSYDSDHLVVPAERFNLTNEQGL